MVEYVSRRFNNVIPNYTGTTRVPYRHVVNNVHPLLVEAHDEKVLFLF